MVPLTRFFRGPLIGQNLAGRKESPCPFGDVNRFHPAFFHPSNRRKDGNACDIQRGSSCHSTDVIPIMSFISCIAGFSGFEIWIIWSQCSISCLFGLLPGVCIVCVVCDVVCELIVWFVRKHHIHFHYDA